MLENLKKFNDSKKTRPGWIKHSAIAVWNILNAEFIFKHLTFFQALSQFFLNI